MSWAEIRQFGWSWRPTRGGETVVVARADLPSCASDRDGPFESGWISKDGSSVFCALRLENGWLAGKSNEGTGELWWMDLEGRRRHFLIDESVDAMYRTPEGIVVFSSSYPGGKVLFYRTLPHGWPELVGLQVIDENHVMSYQQADDSILFWTVHEIGMVGLKGDVSWICKSDRVEGVPRAAVRDDVGSTLLFTTRGLYRADGQDARRICEIDTDVSFPAQRYTPMIKRGPGEILIGLTYYVVRLLYGENGCSQEWYVPASCSKTELMDGRCVCTEGSLAGEPCSML